MRNLHVQTNIRIVVVHSAQITVFLTFAKENRLNTIFEYMERHRIIRTETDECEQCRSMFFRSKVRLTRQWMESLHVECRFHLLIGEIFEKFIVHVAFE